MRETSLKAFDQVRPYLSDSRRRAFEGVIIYRRRHDRWPTAPEVHELLVSLDMVKATSCTKARITELKDIGQLEEFEIREHGPAAYKVRPTNRCIRHKVLNHE